MIGIKVERPEQIQGTDVAYIRLAHGFAYLVVVMDWASSYEVSWELLNTLDWRFCVEALRRALLISRPEIFNTKKGVQFTAVDFTGLLEREEVRVSMDGRCRVYDHIFVEQLWLTIKYEEVYLHEYQTVAEVRESLRAYFEFYNKEKWPQSLGYWTPPEVYFGSQAVKKSVEISV